MASEPTDDDRNDGPSPGRGPASDRPSNRTNLAAAFVVSLILGVIAARSLLSPEGTAPSASPSTVTIKESHMGAPWGISVAATNGMSSAEVQSRIAAAYAEVERVESVMSEWRSTSPISAVNAAAGGEPVEVPDELRDIILRANEISRLSGGAFDITWKGMGDLWRWDDEDFTPPDEERIRRARKRIGWRKIVVEQDRVGLPDEGMQIGLGGIAKGYGVDRAARVLRDAGLRNFMIDGGGDIYVAGRKHGRPWRLGIRHPREGRDSLLATLALSDAALVTSGDYERSRVIDGVRVHHIVDPRTGRPTTLCQSVSVIAPDAETADALATAVFVLGPREGLKLIAGKERTEALVVDAEGQLWTTEGFDAVKANQTLPR